MNDEELKHEAKYRDEERRRIFGVGETYVLIFLWSLSIFLILGMIFTR